VGAGRPARVEPEALVSFLGALLLVYQPAKDLGRVSQFAIGAAAALERIEAVLNLPELKHHGVKDLAPLKSAISLQGRRVLVGRAGGARWGDAVHPYGEGDGAGGRERQREEHAGVVAVALQVPTRGQMRFDGVDVAEASLASIRSQFALVTQEPLLFSSTVKDNLLVARPGCDGG